MLSQPGRAYLAELDSIENSFTYQYGTIELAGGVASLTVPEGYKFLDSEQSEYVLTELWGNPPQPCLGLLFHENSSPMDDMDYAVEITYEEEGFIEDDDAEDIDYDELLEELQADALASNEQRNELGYESVELVGWASPPYYDKVNKKLHWAKELAFSDTEGTTLNYNIRVLGRRGYVVMNAIGDMEVLPTFQNDIDDILGSVEFLDGNRYADFNPDIDEVAAYGIGGLVAGKLLAKAGFFAVLLKFWKIIAVAVVGLFTVLKGKIFGSKT